MIFQGWGAVDGAGAALLIELAAPFQHALIEARAPHNYPFTKSLELPAGCSAKAGSPSAPHREAAQKLYGLAVAAGDPPPPTDAVVETNPWYGYRLNPIAFGLSRLPSRSSTPSPRRKPPRSGQHA